MEVRKVKKWIDDEGHTYQRAPNRPLELLARNAPTTGKKADLRVPTSAEGADGPTC